MRPLVSLRRPMLANLASSIFSAWLVVLSATGLAETPFARLDTTDKRTVLEIGWTVYANPSTQKVITLVPMIHIGDQTYYDAVEKFLAMNDMVLYEMIRPPGFYGPPFEQDPTLVTQEQSLKRTQLRMQALGLAMGNYEKKHGRAATSWQEVLGDRMDFMVQTLLFNTWGRPLQLVVSSDGVLDVVTEIPQSNGSAQVLRLSELPRLHFPLAMRLMRSISNKTEKLANETGLALQRPFEAFTQPTSHNIDVSVDQLFGVPLWRLGELPARWRARNEHPVQRLTEILAEPNQNAQKIAIVYGAAHAIDFHRALTKNLGFEVVQQMWFPVFADTDATISAEPKKQFLRRFLIKRVARTIKAGIIACSDLLRTPVGP